MSKLDEIFNQHPDGAVALLPEEVAEAKQQIKDLFKELLKKNGLSESEAQAQVDGL